MRQSIARDLINHELSRIRKEIEMSGLSKWSSRFFNKKIG